MNNRLFVLGSLGAPAVQTPPQPFGTGELERTLGKKTYELEIAGKALAGWE